MPQDLLYEKKFWNVQVSLESTFKCCNSSELPSNVYGGLIARSARVR
jgi:hypothetical protein